MHVSIVHTNRLIKLNLTNFNFKNILLLLIMVCAFCGCATNKNWSHPNANTHPSQYELTPKQTSELQQGRRYFETGYYKHAMRMLLPLACDGNAEAEYAVGYMYYYGYGVAQDTDVGLIWIRRAADQGYQPAIHALALTQKEQKQFVVRARRH